jgi:hypothetical protein
MLDQACLPAAFCKAGSYSSSRKHAWDSGSKRQWGSISAPVQLTSGTGLLSRLSRCARSVLGFAADP